MALERQTIAVPFAGGLDQKTDPRQVEPGKQTEVVNGVFTSLKAIRKRPAYSELGLASAPSGIDTLATRGDELVAVTAAGSLYAYDAAAAAWRLQGTLPPAFELRRKPIFRASSAGGAGSTFAAAINSAGHILTVAKGRTGGVFQIVAADGTFVASGTVTSANRMAVAPLGTGWVVVQSGGTGVAYQTVSATGVVGSLQVLYAGGAVSRADACGWSSGGIDRAYIAYTTSTSRDVQVGYLDALGAWTSAVTVGLSLPASRLVTELYVEQEPSTDNLLIAAASHKAAEADIVHGSVMSSALAVVTAAVTLYTADTSSDLVDSVAVGVTAAGLPEAYFGLYDYSSSVTLGAYAIYAVPFTGYAAGTPRVAALGFTLVGGPVVHGGSTYVCGVSRQSYGTHAVLRVDSGASPAIVGVATSTDGGIAAAMHPLRISSAEFGWACQVATSARQSGVDLVTLADQVGPRLAQQYAQDLYVGGGLLWHYDGAGVAECGFINTPTLSTPSVSGVGGSIAEGAYQYLAVWVYTDANGGEHLSATSAIQFATTTGATSTVTVNATWVNATNRANAVHAVRFYRTLVNGSTFYFHTELDYASINADGITVTLTDTLADASISSRETVYTTGGVLDNELPPAPRALGVYRGRLFVVSAERENQVWFSHQVIPGYPVEFSSLLVVNLDDVLGPCTALASLDDKLILFKEAVSYYLAGQGPDRLGGNNDFTPPILINANSGCVEPRSVVTAGPGVMYQSQKGLYLLDRSLSDHYVGAGVEDYRDAAVTSAQMVPGENEARFTISDSATCLLYDFLVGQWAVETIDAAGGLVGGVAWNGTHVVALSGHVLQATTTPGTDTVAGVAVAAPLSVTTAWLAAAQLGGYQRVYDLVLTGEVSGGTSLQVSIYYDYDDATAEVHDVDTGVAGAFRVRIRPARQKSTALKIRITDPGTGDVVLSALTLLVGAKRGVAKLPSSMSV